MLTPVCLLQRLVGKKFQSLRRSLNNLVSHEGSNDHNNDAGTVDNHANSDRNNVEKMLHHCMMLHGLESSNLMLEMVLLQDLQKNLLSRAE
jgi:hypothetical protein